MNCFLPWNLKDMLNISSEKLQKNIGQQISFIELYRTELLRESLRFNVASLLRHVAMNRISFGADDFSRKATDCLIVFLHAVAFQKTAYFAPTDVENPAVGKCARNLHRLMLENLKSTMKYIDYSVLLSVARGSLSEFGMYSERERIYSEVFPDNDVMDVCGVDDVNDQFFKLIDRENAEPHGFVDFDVMRNTTLSSEICSALSGQPRRDSELPESEYGIIGASLECLKTPFIKYSGSYYCFVAQYCLKYIAPVVEQLAVEPEQEEEPEIVSEPKPEQEEDIPFEEPEPEEESEEEAAEPEEEPEEEIGSEEETEPEPEAEPVPEFVVPEPEEEPVEKLAEEPVEEYEEETPEPEPEQEEDIPFEEPAPVEEEPAPEPEPEPEPIPEPEPEPIVEPIPEPEIQEAPDSEEEDEIPFDEPEDTDEYMYDDEEEDEEEQPDEDESFSDADSAYTETDEYEYPDEFEEDTSNSLKEAEEEEEEVYDIAEDDQGDEPVAVEPTKLYDDGERGKPYTALVSPDTYEYLNEADASDFQLDPYLEEQEVYEEDEEDEESSQNEEPEEDPYNGESLFSMTDEIETEEEESSRKQDETVTDSPEEQQQSFPEDEEEEAHVPAPHHAPEPEAEPESESEPEAEPESESAPEPEPEEPAPAETLPLLDQILRFAPSRNNPIVQYLTACTPAQQQEIVRVIELARKAWLRDSKDKMFTIPDTNISVAVFSETQDPMVNIQRRENIGAVMFASRKDGWNSLELSYDASGQLTRADFNRISRSDFSEWEWKIVEKLGTRLIERRGK